MDSEWREEFVFNVIIDPYPLTDRQMDRQYRHTDVGTPKLG